MKINLFFFRRKTDCFFRGQKAASRGHFLYNPIFFCIIGSSAAVSVPGASAPDTDRNAEIEFDGYLRKNPNGGKHHDKQYKTHKGRPDDAAGHAGGGFDRSGLC
jgi:hypothetical protein